MTLKKQKNIGFTLVETLVAIAILTISVMATFTAVQSSLQDSYYARDQITAFYLIQEAIEFIRNARDNNALANNYALSNPTLASPVNWLSSISFFSSDPCYFGNVCEIDSPQKKMTFCGTNFGSCPVLNEDTVSGLFGYNGNWTPAKFKREIQLQKITSDEIVIVVRVSWGSGLSAKVIQVQETLFNTR
jgi:prepilin-type N-terminal cleavage/methylation domain-containing protein